MPIFLMFFASSTLVAPVISRSSHDIDISSAAAHFEAHRRATSTILIAARARRNFSCVRHSGATANDKASATQYRPPKSPASSCRNRDNACSCLLFFKSAMKAAVIVIKALKAKQVIDTIFRANDRFSRRSSIIKTFSVSIFPSSASSVIFDHYFSLHGGSSFNIRLM